MAARSRCGLVIGVASYCCNISSALKVVAGIFFGRLCKIFLRVPQNVEIKIKIGKAFSCSILGASESTVYSGLSYIKYVNHLAFPAVRALKGLERRFRFSDFDFFMRSAAVGEKKMNKTVEKTTDLCAGGFVLSQVFLYKVNKRVNVFVFCENGAGCGLVAASLAAVNLGVILHQLAAVYTAV